MSTNNKLPLKHLAVRLDRSHHVRMRAYSLDLRRKVVEAVLRGMPKAEAARTFGIGISTVKRYVGKAHKGEDLAPSRPPGKYGPNVTLLASMTHGGMGPCLAVEGATTSKVFETYIEQMLGPALRPGQIVVMDNLSSHKGKRVRELIEGRGCELLYLPPYSPDLNPIEVAFAKVKGLLREAEARTREALVQTLGGALSAVSARDAWGYLEHCGYHVPDRPLFGVLLLRT
jgi:transposase